MQRCLQYHPVHLFVYKYPVDVDTKIRYWYDPACLGEVYIAEYTVPSGTVPSRRTCTRQPFWR